MRTLTIVLAVACTASICGAQSQAYRLDGEAVIGDHYGWSVAFTGDANGDGRPDVIVGAPFNDFAGTSAGAVYLYSGKTGLLIRAWHGEFAHDLFGWSVDGIGDQDGDGRTDILVGAPLYDSQDAGRCYVYSGRTGGLIRQVTANQPGCKFGSVVRRIGDVTGDGVEEFAVGAPYFDYLHADDGMVLFFAGGTGSPFFGMYGAEAGDLLGYAVEGLIASGSTSSSRILIGSPGAGPGNQGQVRVVSPAGYLQTTLTGYSPNGWFGSALAKIGDLDGDGNPEFAIGEPFANLTAVQAGRVVVYEMPGTVKLVLHGNGAGDRFGEQLASLGDFDGDGLEDFLASAPLSDLPGPTDSGRVVVLSASTGAELASWSGHANDSLGRGLASAGDLNHDGIPDFLIGAPSSSSGTGEVLAVLSHAPLPSTYCSAKINSVGCTPQISYAGAASLSVADDFHVTAQSVLNNKTGLAIWSHGSATTPFNGAILCVQAPVFRTPGQSSGGSTSGSDCTGAYDFHFTQAYLLSKGVAAGNTLYAQVWSRDQGFAPPQNFGLTDGLRIDVVP